MTWDEAVTAMLSGKTVRRKSEIYRKQISEDVFECGVEGCVLAYAWTIDNTPVRVFRGDISKELFVPDSEDFDATDWVIDPE